MSNWWIEEYKKFHRDINDYGNGGALKFHHLHIDDLIKDTVAETLLDFGCGKAEIYTENDWHWPMPTLYDPAIPEYSELPSGTFHGVLSTDVLEHVPEEQLPEKVNQHAPKEIYCHIKTYGDSDGYVILNEEHYLEWYINGI